MLLLTKKMQNKHRRAKGKEKKLFDFTEKMVR